MDVTNKELIEKLPLIQKTINDCDFYSIDFEMTGIYFGNKENHFESLNDKLSKTIEGSSRYQIIQAGICPVKYNPSTKCYEFYPFCFYIFPGSFMNFKSSPEISCITNCLSFLASNNFDFNKWITNGLSYCKLDQMEKVVKEYSENIEEINRKLLSFNQQGKKSSYSLDFPKSSIALDQCKKAIDFIENNAVNIPLDLDVCDSGERASIYWFLTSNFGNSIKISSKLNDNKDRFLNVEKICSNDAIKALEEQRTNLEKKYQSFIGFSYILSMLIESKKPLVGHNMFMDLVMLFNQFIEPLPHNFDDLKRKVHKYFPTIFDSKVIALNQQAKLNISNTSLGPLYTQLKNSTDILKTEISNNEQFNRYEEDKNQCHDAGFDAYMTAYCFLNLINNTEKETGLKDLTCCFNNNIISQFVNKINLMDIECTRFLDLNEVSTYPEDIQMRNIFKIHHSRYLIDEVISSLFGLSSDMKIIHINNESSFVYFFNENKSDQVYKDFVESNSSSLLTQKELFDKFIFKIQRMDQIEDLAGLHYIPNPGHKKPKLC